MRKAVREIAHELVALYQKRATVARAHAFGPDTPGSRRWSTAFIYNETPDQLKAIADVKADMEAPDAHGPTGLR